MLALNVANPDAAWKIVGLIACCARFDQVQYFANTVLEAASPIARAISMLVGEPLRVVEECLAANSDLISVGPAADARGRADRRLQRALSSCRCGSAPASTAPTRGFAEMRNALLGEPLASGVGPDDYEHVAADRDLVTAVLKGGAGRPGGRRQHPALRPPGSGKTELAKVAAKAAGLVLYAAGEETQQGGEADRAQPADRSRVLQPAAARREGRARCCSTRWRTSRST